MKKLTKIGLIGIILAAWTFWRFIIGWYKAWEELWKAKFYDASDAMEAWVRNGWKDLPKFIFESTVSFYREKHLN